MKSAILTIKASPRTDFRMVSPDEQKEDDSRHTLDKSLALTIPNKKKGVFNGICG